jgi:hypothetical protein
MRKCGGRRLSERLRRRIPDADLERGLLFVRSGKGGKAERQTQSRRRPGNHVVGIMRGNNALRRSRHDLYCALVKLNWKVAVILLPSVALLGTGCSGINTSHSVSPATFLIPGLLKAEPARPDAEPVPEVTPPVQIARSR